jgi:twinkle protein
MKYQSSNTKQVFTLDFNDFDGKKRYACPECAPNSKRRNPKDLQFYPKTKTAWCFKCNTTFFEYNPHSAKKEYITPEWKNKTDLTDKSVKWFNSRMISQGTLNLMKVYSDNQYMPQFEKDVEVICFPMFMGDKLINIKYRGPQKTFKLNSGSELIWYNYNALLSNNEIIIVEGEVDLLTWIENGFTNVISVPNGAGGNVEYLDNSIELFDKIGKVYLATDNDTKGIQLRDELVRRIGVEKCSIISFKEHKDSNAFFCEYGGIEFKELINNAKPVPIKGIINIGSIYSEIRDLHENGIPEGNKIDIQCIDKYIRWELGRLAIVTGVPSSGKSEFVDYIVSRLNLIHGWKAA